MNSKKTILKLLSKTNHDELLSLINEMIKENDEALYIILGVLFEITWNSSNDDEKNNIINKTIESLK